jgi:DNA-binding transcriptional regulator YiaG
MGQRQNLPSEDRLKRALKLIQLRVQVRLNRTLTNSELAELAGVGDRSFGDWMRGTYAPAGANAILQLLSLLKESDVSEVLSYWNSSAPKERRNTSVKKATRSMQNQKPSDTAVSKKKARQ